MAKYIVRSLENNESIEYELDMVHYSQSRLITSSEPDEEGWQYFIGGDAYITLWGRVHSHTDPSTLFAPTKDLLHSGDYELEIVDQGYTERLRNLKVVHHEEFVLIHGFLVDFGEMNNG